MIIVTDEKFLLAPDAELDSLPVPGDRIHLRLRGNMSDLVLVQLNAVDKGIFVGEVLRLHDWDSKAEVVSGGNLSEYIGKDIQLGKSYIWKVVRKAVTPSKHVHILLP